MTAKTKQQTGKHKVATKPKPKIMLVNFILDSSGSMNSIKDDTIGGFNEYLNEIRKEDGKDGVDYRFTLTIFGLNDNKTRLVYNSVPLGDVKPLNNDTYKPEANTPLYDAVGKTIRAVEHGVNKETAVITVILTDGMENASREWTLATLQGLIKEKEADGNWTFVYLGVGKDSWVKDVAVSMGISAGNVASYTPSGMHVNSTMRAVAKMSNQRKVDYGVRGMSTTMDAFHDANINTDTLLSDEDLKKKQTEGKTK